MDYSKQIKRYIKGTLSSEEGRDFEKNFMAHVPQLEMLIQGFLNKSDQSPIERKEIEISDIEFLNQLQSEHDFQIVKDLLASLNFKNLSLAYINEEMSPSLNKIFEEMEERSDDVFQKIYREAIIAGDFNQDQGIQYIVKKNQVREQRKALQDIFKNHVDTKEIPLKDDFILDYLSGFLMEKDTKLMDQIVEKYPSIKTYVEEQKILLQQIKSYDEEEDDLNSLIGSVASQLQTEGFFDQEVTTEPKKSTLSIDKKETKTRSLPWLGIAAAIMLLFAVGIYFWPKESFDYDQLYTQYHEKEETLVIQFFDQIGQLGIANPEHPQKDLKRPIQLYQAGRYDEAITEYNTYLTKKPADNDAKFLLALSYIEAQQLESATLILEDLNNKKTEWQFEIKFQLAMIYLKSSTKITKSKALLNEVSQQNDAYYQQMAIKILRDLE